MGNTKTVHFQYTIWDYGLKAASLDNVRVLNNVSRYSFYSYANDIGKTNICVNEVGTVIFRLKKLSFLCILKNVMHTTIHNLLVEV